MNITAVGERILVKRTEKEQISSGLILTNSKAYVNYGEVLSAGSDVKGILVGMKVLFEAGVEIHHDGEDYIVLKKSDIIGVEV
jgi:co-chaperonin GroES (HSP10)